MALFGNLFEKKNCAICGGEIGLLGNRKLADGNLCKRCAEQLSPFYSERRQSTVAEIREHLDYRERNKRVLLGMTPTRAFGRGWNKVYVDENQGQFFVTRERNYMAVNPDVFSVSQVIGFQPSIHENRTELYHHDREGRRVPYNPRRYQVEYRFDVTIQVNAPFVTEISFEFSAEHPDSPRSDLYRTLQAEILALQDALNPANYTGFAPTAMVGAEPVRTGQNGRWPAASSTTATSAPTAARKSPWCSAATSAAGCPMTRPSCPNSAPTAVTRSMRMTWVEAYALTS